MSLIGDFFSGIKDKVVAKALEKQLEEVPPEQRDMLMAAMKRDPELFETIAKEIEQLKKSGKMEVYASLEVAKKYQSRLHKAMMGGNNKAA